MFKISTKGEYGIHLMEYLAQHYDSKGEISLRIIADKKALPYAYAGRIAKLLKAAKLISAKEGANGGYHLAKKPTEITLGEILRAIEGDVSPVQCLGDAHCPVEAQCLSRSAWEKVKKKIDRTLDTIKLSEIIS